MPSIISWAMEGGHWVGEIFLAFPTVTRWLQGFQESHTPRATPSAGRGRWQRASILTALVSPCPEAVGDFTFLITDKTESHSHCPTLKHFKEKETGAGSFLKYLLSAVDGLPPLPHSRAYIHTHWWDSACQCGRLEFNPWVREMPWRRKWQSAPVFSPGKSHGQRSLASYSPWGHTESDNCVCVCV